MISIAPNSTFTPDTPENWANFNRLKERLLNPKPGDLSGTFNRRLQAQISRENKRLKTVRTFLPGYEPDRW